jgi:cardiolipin synthase (CMP-forming)
MANALTSIRLFLVAPFAFFMARGDKQSAIFALLVWCVALLTDFLDGALARRRGLTSAFGETFDHTSDFLFVTSGMFAAAYRGAFPWILPVLIVAAFAQYVIGSYRMNRRPKLRGNKLGRYNGMLYFVPPCMEAVTRLGASILQPVLTVLVWLLVASTIVSMGQRLTLSRSVENFPSGPAEK